MENLIKDVLEYCKSKNMELDFFDDTCSNNKRTVYIFKTDIQQLILLCNQFKLELLPYNGWETKIISNINMENEQGFYIGYNREIAIHKDSFDLKNNNCTFRVEFFH